MQMQKFKLLYFQKFNKLILMLNTLMLNQLTEFQKTFELIKQIPEKIELIRAKSSELSDIEIQKKVLPGHNAAYFSCANLQLSMKTKQYCSNENKSQY